MANAGGGSGIIGLTTDMFLAWLGTVLFPWKRKSRVRKAQPIPISAAGNVPKMVEAWLRWAKDNGYRW